MESNHLDPPPIFECTIFGPRLFPCRLYYWLPWSLSCLLLRGCRFVVVVGCFISGWRLLVFFICSCVVLCEDCGLCLAYHMIHSLVIHTSSFFEQCEIYTTESCLLVTSDRPSDSSFLLLLLLLLLLRLSMRHRRCGDEIRILLDSSEENHPVASCARVWRIQGYVVAGTK
jgi:hypothetical protein